MASKRIYEVAKQYNISSNALVQMLRDLNHTVKSHMSVMDEKMVLDVNMRFEQEKLAARVEQGPQEENGVAGTILQSEGGEGQRARRQAENRNAASGQKGKTFLRSDESAYGSRRRPGTPASIQEEKEDQGRPEGSGSERTQDHSPDGRYPAPPPSPRRPGRRRSGRNGYEGHTRSGVHLRGANWPSIFSCRPRTSYRNACSSD